MMTHPVQQTVERRKTARQKSFLRGTLTFNDRRTVVDCTIRDISPFGARLTFAAAVQTPDAVDLHIPQKDQTLRCHVIWRHGQEVGVAFAQAQQEDHAHDGELADRVARLEAEIAALKRVLKKMKTDAGPEFDVA